MRIKFLILICSVLLGFGAAAYTVQTGTEAPPRAVAWWSLMYERPNPEKLPVKVHFWWAEEI